MERFSFYYKLRIKFIFLSLIFLSISSYSQEKKILLGGEVGGFYLNNKAGNFDTYFRRYENRYQSRP